MSPMFLLLWHEWRVERDVVSHLMVEVVERGLVLGEVAEEPFGQVAYPEFIPGNTEGSHDARKTDSMAGKARVQCKSNKAKGCVVANGLFSLITGYTTKNRQKGGRKKRLSSPFVIKRIVFIPICAGKRTRRSSC